MPNPWLNEHKSTAAMGMNYFFSKHFSFSLLGFGKPFPKWEVAGTSVGENPRRVRFHYIFVYTLQDM
jgi:hypothetical protein